MNDVAQQQINPLAQFKHDWDRNKVEVAKQLPKGVDPDRFMRTVITTVQGNHDLLKADRGSLFNACMQAAKDGLLPDGREATIQIYRTNIGTREAPRWVEMAQYMPMVRGLIKKMYEAGCTKVDAAAVYEKDHFRFARGDESIIEHEPYLGMDEPGPIIAAYAIVKLENGEVKREVMPRRDIEKVRLSSKAASGPGWTTWYDQFAIKAVLKRIYKQVPGRSDEFEQLAASDNEALGITIDQFGQNAEDYTAPVRTIESDHQPSKLPPEESRASRLKRKLEAEGAKVSTAAELQQEEAEAKEVIDNEADAEHEEMSEEAKEFLRELDEAEAKEKAAAKDDEKYPVSDEG